MLFFAVFAVTGHAWITSATNMAEVNAPKNVNVSLICTAKMKPGVDYRAVRWYKEGVDPRLTGLVSRTPPGGMLRWYVDADTRISLEYPSLSLLLPPVSCSDAGVYQCYLAAPVGEQNREGRVRLTVEGCPTERPVIFEKHEEIAVEHTRLRSESDSNKGYLLIGGSVGVLLIALVIFLLSYRSLRKTLWHNTKTPGKEPFPDPNSPPEKLDLLWTTNLDPSPKNSNISAA